MTAIPRKMHFGRYDYAAFATFSAYASCSLAIPIVLVTMARELGFPLERGGMTAGGGLHLVRSLSMCVAMVLCGFAAARWGNRRSVGVAVGLMGGGILLCAFTSNYAMLVMALLLAGLGEGTVEGLGTPLVQNLHSREPGRYVNFAHGFWSLGILSAVMIFGLLLTRGSSWRLVLGVASLFMAPALLLLWLPERRRPYPERHESVSAREVCAQTRTILREARFWRFFAAMFLAGGGEYCLTFWCASFIQLNFAGTALAGAAGTAVFSLGMFLGRTGFGLLVGQKKLRQLVVWAGFAAAAVSSLLPILARHEGASGRFGALFLVLFLSGVATAPFWPSIQSYTVDAMPHLDATMVFVILSCAGVPGCGVLTWLMGLVGDLVGLDYAFYLVPACFVGMSLLLMPRRSPRQTRTRSSTSPTIRPNA